MAKTKTESTTVVEQQPPTPPVDNSRLEELENVMLTMHKLCWLFARTPKCATQAEAYRTLNRIRKIVGEDKAEQLEKEWRGIVVNKE